MRERKNSVQYHKTFFLIYLHLYLNLNYLSTQNTINSSLDFSSLCSVFVKFDVNKNHKKGRAILIFADNHLKYVLVILKSIFMIDVSSQSQGETHLE